MCIFTQKNITKQILKTRFIQNNNKNNTVYFQEHIQLTY